MRTSFSSDIVIQNWHKIALFYSSCKPQVLSIFLSSDTEFFCGHLWWFEVRVRVIHPIFRWLAAGQYDDCIKHSHIYTGPMLMLIRMISVLQAQYNFFTCLVLYFGLKQHPVFGSLTSYCPIWANSQTEWLFKSLNEMFSSKQKSIETYWSKSIQCPT